MHLNLFTLLDIENINDVEECIVTKYKLVRVVHVDLTGSSPFDLDTLARSSFNLKSRVRFPVGVQIFIWRWYASVMFTFWSMTDLVAAVDPSSTVVEDRCSY